MWGKFAESQAKSQVTESLYEVKKGARTQQTTELMQVRAGARLVMEKEYRGTRGLHLSACAT